MAEDKATEKEKIKPFVKGYETHIITTFRKFKGLILDLLRGYPAYVYYGKFESVFAENGEKIVDILDEHQIIEILKENEVKENKLIEKLPPEEIKILKQQGKTLRWYRLTSKGVDLAISLINLDYSEKVLKHSKQMKNYSKQMKNFTITVIVIGGLALLVGVIHIILTFFQNPIFNPQHLPIAEICLMAFFSIMLILIIKLSKKEK